MSVGECIFCKIVAGEIPCMNVYEDEAVLAFLDVGPVSDGHTLVIPREHVERLDQCSVELLAKISSCIGKIAGAVADAMDADGYNVLCNNGRAAGQLVEHFHFHLIPRKTDDGVFSHWPSYQYGPGRAEDILQKIFEKL